LDSILKTDGQSLKVAHEKAARDFGASNCFRNESTATSTKIAAQAMYWQGDIVLGMECHKSHHYGLVLCGGQPLYVEAYPLTRNSMYGAAR